MAVSICTQKEFLIESKLNGFFGGFIGEISGAATPSPFKIISTILYVLQF